MFRRPVLMLCALAAVAAILPARGEDPKQDEWTTIFDGRSLEGWQMTGPGKFVLADSAMYTEGGMGLLWYTKQKFGDCVIKVVYKTTKPQDNSGVFIRIADKPDDPWFAVHNGYEVQIADQADEYHRTGAIYSLSKSTGTGGKVGEWNTLEVTLEGDLVKVAVNGAAVNTFDPKGPVPPRTKEYEPKRGPRPESGYIGLQNHDERSRVYFKEIAVRPLRTASR
jgi:hypothetical protein